jgi:hypothetical protein
MIGHLIESHSEYLSLYMCIEFIICAEKIIHPTVWLSHYKSLVILIKRMCCFGGFAVGNINILTPAIYPAFNYTQKGIIMKYMHVSVQQYLTRVLHFSYQTLSLCTMSLLKNYFN